MECEGVIPAWYLAVWSRLVYGVCVCYCSRVSGSVVTVVMWSVWVLLRQGTW
jgi:hypothetical protein